MVPKYGATNTDDLRTEAAQGEASALLGNDATPRKPTLEGNATVVSGASNLANTIIGSGMLTFPLAMASSGLIPGMISCVFCGMVAAFGLHLLSLCATHTPHRRSSFFAVSKLTFPKAAVLLDAAIAIKCFGVSISYLIIIKSLMPNVVASLYHDLTSPETNPPDWAMSGQIWLTIFMVILVPLCFRKTLNSLRHTSYIALFAVAYLVLIVVVCYFWPIKGMSKPGRIDLIHFTPNFVSTFPVQVFAFTCAQNLFPIYNELYNNTQERMDLVIGSAIGSAVLTYEVIAVFGYLTFGSKVGANIIAMYPSTSIFIAIGQLAIVILVLFSYALQVHPCRNCLDKVFSAGLHSKAVAQADVDDDSIDEVEDEHSAHEMSKKKRRILTAGVVAGGFAIAYFVSDLQLVLSFVGSTGSTTISFILPGMFYWQLTRHDTTSPRWLNKAALALMIYGICIFVFCLSFNIYKVTHRAQGPEIPH